MPAANQANESVQKNLEEAQKKAAQVKVSTIGPGTAGPSITTKSANVLQYPTYSPMTEDTDYVSFSFFEYTPAFDGVGKNSAGTTSDAASLGARYKQYSGSITDMTKAKGYSPIVMYMPQDIQGQYGANWGGAGFGAFFTTIAGAMTGVTDGKFGDSLKTFADDFKGFSKIAGYKAAVAAMNKGLGTNVSVSQLMQGVSGTIINPNIELMYEAPEMRGFQLRFKMMARDQKEGDTIRSIYNTFKRAMLPTFGGSVGKSSDGQSGGLLGDLGKAGSLMTVPKIVQVQFMTGSKMNTYVPQYKPCAITQVDLTHTADGSWAAYEGGMPVAVEMAVTFKETKLIFADEIKDGEATF
tara:strand:- start:918 stop:1976 length:1059 start_codon:yes stop_codon:yes gene_type:complete